MKIGSGGIGRLNIIGIIMRYAVVGVIEEEAGMSLKVLQRLEEVIDDVPSPLDQLLRKWTENNMTGGLPTNEDTTHVLALT